MKIKVSKELERTASMLSELDDKTKYSFRKLNIHISDLLYYCQGKPSVEKIQNVIEQLLEQWKKGDNNLCVCSDNIVHSKYNTLRRYHTMNSNNEESHTVNVKVWPAHPEAMMPVYSTPGAACADVRALTWGEPDKIITIKSGETRLIKTGLHMELPKSYRLTVMPRSGLALKHSLTIPNSPGILDEDYRGELGIIVTNLGPEDYIVNNADRIAQIAIEPVIRGNFIQVNNKDDLSDTTRGDGGFGSTGKS